MSPPADRVQEGGLDGRAAEAARIAEELLRQSPRDHAGATIVVLAAASSGAGAALDAYERWLDASRHEDAFILEPVARAVLQEIAASRGTLDAEAKERLAASTKDGAETDLAEGRRIAADLGRKDSGNPILLMRALAKTRYAEGASEPDGAVVTRCCRGLCEEAESCRFAPRRCERVPSALDAPRPRAASAPSPPVSSGASSSRSSSWLVVVPPDRSADQVSPPSAPAATATAGAGAAMSSPMSCSERIR